MDENQIDYFGPQGCYPGCRQAAKTLATSGSFGMIPWLWTSTEDQFRWL